MSVLTRSIAIPAEVFGDAAARMLSIWTIAVAVVRDAFALRRSMMKRYDVSEW